MSPLYGFHHRLVVRNPPIGLSSPCLRRYGILGDLVSMGIKTSLTPDEFEVELEVHYHVDVRVLHIRR